MRTMNIQRMGLWDSPHLLVHAWCYCRGSHKCFGRRETVRDASGDWEARSDSGYVVWFCFPTLTCCGASTCETDQVGNERQEEKGKRWKEEGKGREKEGKNGGWKLKIKMENWKEEVNSTTQLWLQHIIFSQILLCNKTCILKTYQRKQKCTALRSLKPLWASLCLCYNPLGVTRAVDMTTAAPWPHSPNSARSPTQENALLKEWFWVLFTAWGWKQGASQGDSGKRHFNKALKNGLHCNTTRFMVT